MNHGEFFDGFEYSIRHEEDVTEFFVGPSRDGVLFDLQWLRAGLPFIPRGEAGTFDQDGVQPPSSIVTHGDRHWIFYGGMSERHYSRGRHMAIGLAMLRLDGFVGLQAYGNKP